MKIIVDGKYTACQLGALEPDKTVKTICGNLYTQIVKATHNIPFNPDATITITIEWEDK